MTKTQVSAGTIARTICLFLALINQVMTATGHSVLPIDDDMVTELVSLLATVAAALIAWWKNNSFTQAARIADQTMKGLKGKNAAPDGEGPKAA